MNKTNVEVDLSIEAIEGLLTIMKCNLTLKGFENDTFMVTRDVDDIVNAGGSNHPIDRDYIIKQLNRPSDDNATTVYVFYKNDFVDVYHDDIAVIEPLDEELLRAILGLSIDSNN